MMNDFILSQIECLNNEISKIDTLKIYGRVRSIKGILIECEGINKFLKIGSKTKVHSLNDLKYILCEVVGFDQDIALMMPFDTVDGLSSGSPVEVYNAESEINPDLSWLGRIINGFGEPIDNKGPLKSGIKPYPLHNKPPQSQKRARIGGKIDLGVKVIDLFTSCCYGQRMGIFAGSGVGKSVLISMLTKYAKTDVKVIGLIGERSREVKEFIEEYLGTEGLQNAIIVVATGDESALMRKRATYTTIAVAEYFRDQGKEVLCIIDSITRFAMAQREIGLAVGEPPTTKGYTPSVFSELPKILERAGTGENDCHITGLFTVLVEGDDHNEPISDAVRGTVDGHIVMSREIASRGRFPAVDVLQSVSRAMPKCNSELENKQIAYARRMLSTYNDMAEMIRLGAYKKGSNQDVDLAINYYNKIEEFLTQKPDESYPMSESYQKLGEILMITN